MVCMTLVELIRGIKANMLVIGHADDQDPLDVLASEMPITPDMEVTIIGPLEGHFAPVEHHFAWEAKRILRKGG